MSRKSRAELFKEWETLLVACRERNLPGMEELVDPLASVMVQIKVLEVVRRAMSQTARETTLSLHEVRATGRESARRLRSYLKARFGAVPETSKGA
jgi:hypothetical protein